MAVCLVALVLESQQCWDVVLIADTGSVYLTADAQHGSGVRRFFSNRASTPPKAQVYDAEDKPNKPICKLL